MASNNKFASRVAVRTALVLALILMLDFATRLVWFTELRQVDEADQPLLAQQQTSAILLDVKQVSELLSWADVKATVDTSVKVVKAPPKAVIKKAEPVVDKRQLVARRIAGDKSKHLLGDQLLSLKGVFYDAQAFAVVEIEEINSGQKQYYRATQGEKLGLLTLVSIGPNHVQIKNASQQVRLEMFKSEQ